MAALLRRSSRAICQCQRTFSTTTSRPVSLQWDNNDPEALAEVLPDYPYGSAQWYKQSNRGLYGGQRIQFGNSVGEKFKNKTRRTWHPNILTRRLFSKSLKRHVQIRVSTRVLRTIDKLGGLDEYLLGEKEARIKELGESGWWLRWAIMQTHAIKKRFREERQQLGLPADPALADTPEEAAAESIEEAESVDVEAVAMDDAFQIEPNADLPPIKFRVGPGQHVMLTENGWIRTRADPNRLIERRKDQIRRSFFGGFVERRVDTFTQRLANETTITDEEKKQMIKAAKKEFKAEMEAKVDKQYDLELRHVAAKAQQRRAKKKRQSKELAGESDDVATGESDDVATGAVVGAESVN